MQKISGADLIETVYKVDQSPIGKTSRSTPATYIKVFDEIRNLYAQLPVSRIRGYSGSRFSFNTEGGRCEVCSGQGAVKLEMSFCRVVMCRAKIAVVNVTTSRRSKSSITTGASAT